MTKKGNIKDMRKEKTFDHSQTTSNSAQLQILKTNFPQCFDKRGDFIPQKMQEIVSKDGVNLSKESYALNWLGKSYARLLANEQPLTLLKEDTGHNQKKANQSSENLLIKGDNLEVLKHLRHAYSEQVKMIYIDPPYNTGNDDFVYADNRKFSVEQLSCLAGIDEDEAQRILEFTNSNSNSHSAWLTFIYPRLYIARELLSDDGVIFISIDDNEQAQLRMLCDEVFGEGNFLANIVWQKKYATTNDAKGFSNLHDHIIVYQKSDKFERLLLPRSDKQNKPYKNDDKDGKGLWRSDNLLVKSFSEYGVYPIVNINTGQEYLPPTGSCWRASKKTMRVWLKENRVFFGKNGDGAPQLKRYLNEVQQGSVPGTWWKFEDVGHNDAANKELKNIFNVKTPFDTPKPSSLIKQMIKVSSKDGIILDFFAGSGTTADAVMQLNAEDGGNRKCISVQLDEAIDEKKSKTAYDFVKDELGKLNPTIFDITKERILRASAKIQKDNRDSKASKDVSKQDFGFKVFEILPMFDGFLDEVDELNDKQQTIPFNGYQLSDNDLQVLLTTWMVNDGIKLTAKVAKITLDKYSAYYADTSLYFMDKGFTTDDLKALLAKIDSVDANNKDFQPHKLVLFGYNFGSKHQREISEALNSYSNKKQIEIDRIIRY